MALQCTSRRCSPWPLLDIGPNWAGQNQLFTGTTTLVCLPTTEDPFFRNRRGYCCTNARVERSFMLEGLAGQAASTGPRTGSCCCSCCRSAISVGEARWPDPLELPQCRWSSVVRSPSNCLSAGQLRYTVQVPPDSSSTLSAGASRQLLYTVCRCPQTAPLHCLLVSVWLFYFQSCSQAPGL